MSTFKENYHAWNIFKNIFTHPFHTRIGARISVISLIDFLKTPCIVFKLHKKVKSFWGKQSLLWEDTEVMNVQLTTQS